MPERRTVEKARGLRRALTPPEVKLWAILRTRPSGIRVRRQHPIGPFVLDFYCSAAKLAIEVDGIAHDMGTNPQRDVLRDAWLAGRGITALRVPAADVMKRVEDVVAYILAHAAFPLHHATHGEDEE